MIIYFSQFQKGAGRKQGGTMEYIQSFCRYEKKYLLNSEQYEQLRTETEDIIRPDCYGKHTICSVYLDTEDFMFIRNSIESPPYKEKLRIRSYGVPQSDSDVFFEIKKKFQGVVYKRRISANEFDIEKYALTGVPSEELVLKADPQIFSEIDYIMKIHRPLPRVYVAYDRCAFEGIKDPALRITFDANIRSRTECLRLSAGDGGKLLDVHFINEKGMVCTDKNYRLMEIKTDSAIPFELSEILSRLKIFPSSFSKYGEIYKQIIMSEKNKVHKEEAGEAAVC